jgi:hypothetical protein
VSKLAGREPAETVAARSIRMVKRNNLILKTWQRLKGEEDFVVLVGYVHEKKVLVRVLWSGARSDENLEKRTWWRSERSRKDTQLDQGIG